MEHKFIEPNNKNEIFKTYDIYKQCMFIPAEEKFSEKIKLFLNDSAVKSLRVSIKAKLRGLLSFPFWGKGKLKSLALRLWDYTKKLPRRDGRAARRKSEPGAAGGTEVGGIALGVVTAVGAGGLNDRAGSAAIRAEVVIVKGAAGAGPGSIRGGSLTLLIDMDIGDVVVNGVLLGVGAGDDGEGDVGAFIKCFIFDIANTLRNRDAGQGLTR